MNLTRPQLHPYLSALVPNLADFVFAVVFFLALASGAQMLSLDSDLGRHLTIGNYILDNRAVPTRDLFSHTLPDQSRPPYEWLSQVLFALAYDLLGLDGVILLTAIIIAVTFNLVYRFSVKRSASPILAFLITFLAVGASSIHWLPRPHIVTFLFLAVWLDRLEQVRKGQPVGVFAFLCMMLLWANLHGGFLYGILAWAAYFAGWLWERWQRKSADQTGRNLVAIGFVALVASVITPDLWRNWEAVLNNRSPFILSRTVETMAPDLADPSVLPFTIFLGLTFTLCLRNFGSTPASHFFLLGGLGVLALLMLRNIPLFVIAGTPIIAGMAKESLLRSSTWDRIENRFAGFGRQSAGGTFPLAIIIVMLAFFTNRHINDRQPVYQFHPHVFPVQAMDWLESHPQDGQMFNEFNWGGYILHRTWPGQKVFLDSQSDFYGEPLMRDYEQLMSARGDWENLLARYRVDWAIIPPEAPLAAALESRGWKILHEDPTAVILAQE